MTEHQPPAWYTNMIEAYDREAARVAPTEKLTDDEIAAFRAGCMEVRNTGLARLCTDALTGDEHARARITAIITTGTDSVGPTPEKQAELDALRRQHGLI